ncbi:hypothetical protein [Haloarchaeobius sp. DYHT-AS-18]
MESHTSFPVKSVTEKLFSGLFETVDWVVPQFNPSDADAGGGRLGE